MDKPSERYFDSYTEYRHAIVDALGLAQQSLVIFDPDLRECALESHAGATLLESLCAQSPHRDAVRVLVHSGTFLEQECPRLVRLFGQFAHRASVRTTGPGARTWTQPFLIVDSGLVVMRFHQDLPRGKICWEGSSTLAYLDTQFETMWLHADPHAIGAPLAI